MTGQDSQNAARQRVIELPIWKGAVEPERLMGGITNNSNFVVDDGGERFVVRVGQDVPVHQIMRFNERAATRAAALAGISPQVIHTEPGVLVIRFIEGKTCGAGDLNTAAGVERVVPLVKKVHLRLLDHMRGPVLAFWVFHVIRDYAHTLRQAGSRYAPQLPDLVDVAATLEAAVGRVDIVFCHNDLLAANFIDDGARLWLVDWDYAGLNSPLFDLANLASNNDFEPEQERWMLSAYFDRRPDAALMRSYGAMKCASLLREAMWGMVSEIHSTLDFDYRAYAHDYIERFARTYATYSKKVDEA